VTCERGRSQYITLALLLAPPLSCPDGEDSVGEEERREQGPQTMVKPRQEDERVEVGRGGGGEPGEEGGFLSSVVVTRTAARSMPPRRPVARRRRRKTAPLPMEVAESSTSSCPARMLPRRTQVRTCASPIRQSI
jgi:hypothetical protein